MTVALAQPAAPCCLKCRAPLATALYNAPGLTSCPACGAPQQLFVFPALFRPLVPGEAGEQVLSETESSCFYHPQKRAVVPCDGCGRFLCALCDLELDNRHLCPTCLETGKKKGKIAKLQRERVLYDRMALMLAGLPLLMWPFTFVTAPAALFLVCRYWNAPLSITSASRARFVVAGLLAVVQVLLWTAVVVMLIVKK